jgi:hypothetical protein
MSKPQMRWAFYGIHFETPEKLAGDLKQLGFLPE